MHKRIIPCLDIRDGKVVKGTNFVNIAEVGDPLEMARLYQLQGADEVVFLNINAESRNNFYDIIRRAARELIVPITVGGGVRTIEDFRELFACGASKVSVSTAAVLRPELILEASREFGSHRIVAAIDAKMYEPGRYHVYIKGGRQDTGLDLVEWAKKCQDLGAGEILLTSMDGDGTGNGYDLAMTTAVVRAVSIPVIASGGCGSVADIVEVFEETNCSAALAASIFHYGKATVASVRAAISPEHIEGIVINGLMPAIVQDYYTGRVLMHAHVNQESYRQMIQMGEACFWSRSRQEIWHKGATSGNVQKIKSMSLDCDKDTLLIQVEQVGSGACHTGSYSCFGDENGQFNMLDKLGVLIAQRSDDPAENSYTNYLLGAGVDKICKKIGEEAAETIIAAKNRDKSEFVGEASDLMYHLMVLMHEQGVELNDVLECLAGRHGK